MPGPQTQHKGTVYYDDENAYLLTSPCLTNLAQSLPPSHVLRLTLGR